MPKLPQRHYSFDAFTVDVSRGCLMRDGREVKLRPKSFEAFKYLVENRGRLVTKEELINTLWPDSFVTDDSLVKCLRDVRLALGDESHFYIKTVPRRGYIFDADVTERGLLEQEVTYTEQVDDVRFTVEENDERALESNVERKRAEYQSRWNGRRLVATIAAVILVFGVGAYMVFSVLQKSKTGPQSPEMSLVRLTFEAGLQSEPAWSPDGRLLAFSSDRGGDFDIWVQLVDGGDPIQVTNSPAHDWQPHWSSDGAHIVFRSEREGGGLYVVPALGGSERRISTFGFHPRWSPDGSQILFSSLALQTAILAPQVYLVSPDGPPPREVLSETLAQFKFVRLAWHPDGQRVSLCGEHRELGWGFWTVTLVGGSPVRSEITAPVAEQLNTARLEVREYLWAPSGDAIYFEGVSRDVRNIWKVELDPVTLSWIAGPKRLTAGPGPDANIALSRDGKRLAYTTCRESSRIWLLPFDESAGEIKGEGQPITPAELNVTDGELSPDGKKLVFVANRAGKQEFWVKSLEAGDEKLLAADAYRRGLPRWSRDGRRLAYLRSRLTGSETAPIEHSLVVLPTDGSDEQVLTSPSASFELASDWSTDGEWVLASSDRKNPGRFQVDLFPVRSSPHAEAESRVVAADRGHDIWNGRRSPNGSWVSFHAVRVSERGASLGASHVYVMPFEGGEWVRVTEGRHWNGKARWSDDGSMIYFISDRTGFYNVWAVKFDPIGGKPAGEPFRISRFDSPGRMIGPGVGSMGLSFTSDLIVLSLMEVSGSIWMLGNVDR
jgi:Tol biopolymer transport system component/DNA-binding winged helix-turn-helix (wHTH) protein